MNNPILPAPIPPVKRFHPPADGGILGQLGAHVARLNNALDRRWTPVSWEAAETMRRQLRAARAAITAFCDNDCIEGPATPACLGCRMFRYRQAPAKRGCEHAD